VRAVGYADPATLAHLVGERTVPDLWHENYWFRRHEIAYRELAGAVLAAASAVQPGRPVVIEAGSGEGYGLDILRAAGITTVLALDYDAGAVAHAHQRYPQAAVARAGLSALPLASGCAGAVVSFQVIEHLWTPWEFLAECARVLVPGGLLAVTTPNRLTFSPGLGRGEKPPNPFHIKEFDAAELHETIAAQLTITAEFGVGHGPRLLAWEAAHGSLIGAQLATSPDRWSPALVSLVGSITADDFVLAPLADLPAGNLLDLVVLAQNGDAS
jgi:SAM-dependent methyltransferase